MTLNPYQVDAQSIPGGGWSFCLTSGRRDATGNSTPELTKFGYVMPEVVFILKRLCGKPQQGGPAQILRFENHTITPQDESSQESLELTFKEVCTRLYNDPEAKLLWGKSKPVTQEATPVIGAPTPFSMIYGVVPLFGIVTSGAHLNVFHGKGEEMLIWLAQRGPTKSSYPNCFDQIVAGGNDSKQDRTPVDIIRREAREEVDDASIHAYLDRAQGPDAVITYHVFNPTAEGFSAPISAGKMEAGIRFVFDYEVKDANHVIKKNEQDIANMRSYTVAQIRKMLEGNRFKPNCGLVMLNFLVRKGLVKPGDPLYQETERPLEFPCTWD